MPGNRSRCNGEKWGRWHLLASGFGLFPALKPGGGSLALQLQTRL
jgi:hypothetical protein